LKSWVSFPNTRIFLFITSGEDVQLTVITGATGGHELSKTTGNAGARVGCGNYLICIHHYMIFTFISEVTAMHSNEVCLTTLTSVSLTGVWMVWCHHCLSVVCTKMLAAGT